jgi:hypothetical protein
MRIFLCGSRVLLSSLGWQQSIRNFQQNIANEFNEEKIEICYVDSYPYCAQAQKGDIIILVIDSTKLINISGPDSSYEELLEEAQRKTENRVIILLKGKKDVHKDLPSIIVRQNLAKEQIFVWETIPNFNIFLIEILLKYSKNRLYGDAHKSASSTSILWGKHVFLFIFLLIGVAAVVLSFSLLVTEVNTRVEVLVSEQRILEEKNTQLKLQEDELLSQRKRLHYQLENLEELRSLMEQQISEWEREIKARKETLK